MRKEHLPMTLINKFSCTLAIIAMSTLNSIAGGIIKPSPSPLIVNAGEDKLICPGNVWAIGGKPTATGGSGAYQYSWSPIDGLDNPKLANPIANPLFTTNYTVMVTDSKGNVARDVMILVVRALPSLSILTNNSTVCLGSGTQLRCDWGTNFHWYGSNLDGHSGNYVLATPESSTQYSVTGTNPCGRIDTATINISVINYTPMRIVSSDTAVCYGSAVTLRAIGGINRVWQGSDIYERIGDSIVTAFPTEYGINPITNVNGYARYSASDNSRCGGGRWVSAYIRIKQLPGVNAGTDTSICGGGNIRLGGNPSAFGGSGHYSYKWESTEPAKLDNWFGPNPIATPVISTYFILSVRDSVTGCINEHPFPSGYVYVGVDSCESTNELKSWKKTAINEQILGVDAGVKVYPNPYEGKTTISYNLESRSNIILEVFNILGERISTIANGMQGEGNYIYSFSAKEIGYPKGIYIIKLSINDNSQMQKVMEE